MHTVASPDLAKGMEWWQNIWNSLAQGELSSYEIKGSKVPGMAKRGKMDLDGL